MLESDLWRNLAKEFRALDPSGCIFAAWRREKDTGIFRYTVRMSEDSCVSEWHQFVALATRAGAIYAADPDFDPCSRWLHEVNGSLSKQEPSEVIDGTLVGRIPRVSEASANLCNRLEAQFINFERSNPSAASAAMIWRPEDEVEAKRKIAMEKRLDELRQGKPAVGRVAVPDFIHKPEPLLDDSDPIINERRRILNAFILQAAQQGIGK
jgi:hypothetical protein